jgi:excisionase family DNA binding protein
MRVAHCPMPTDQRQALRVLDAADYLGVGKTTLYELARDGHVTTIKLGGRRLFLRESLDKLVASQT